MKTHSTQQRKEIFNDSFFIRKSIISLPAEMVGTAINENIDQSFSSHDMKTTATRVLNSKEQPSVANRHKNSFMKKLLRNYSVIAIAFVIANLFLADKALAQIGLAGGSIANAVQTNTTTSTTLTINRPTSLAIGDIMFANIVQSDDDNNNGGDLSNATSGGWTLIAGNQTGVVGSGGDEFWGTLLFKVATAADVAAPDFDFTWITTLMMVRVVSSLLGCGVLQVELPRRELQEVLLTLHREQPTTM
jgi:hypothetical protein